MSRAAKDAARPANTSLSREDTDLLRRALDAMLSRQPVHPTFQDLALGPALLARVQQASGRPACPPGTPELSIAALDALTFRASSAVDVSMGGGGDGGELGSVGALRVLMDGNGCVGLARVVSVVPESRRDSFGDAVLSWLWHLERVVDAGSEAGR